MTDDLAGRMQRIEARFDWLDEHGTRAVNVLALQVQELAKDFGELKSSVDNAMGTMRGTAQFRTSTFLAFIAIMLPMYGLVAALIVKG